MGDVTVFSFYPLGQTALADPAKAAAAMDEADHLSADVLALDGDARKTALRYFAYLERGYLQAALKAKRKLADRVRHLPPQQWQQDLAKARAQLNSPVSRFGSLSANVGLIARILATDDEIVLKGLSQAPDRLTFARIAVQCFNARYQEILDALLAGRQRPDASLGTSLMKLVDLFQKIQAIDRKKVEAWPDNRDASHLIHELNGLLTKISLLGQMIKASRVVTPQQLLKLQEIVADPQSLQSLVRTAAFDNLLGLAAKNIRLAIHIPKGIGIANEPEGKTILAALVELMAKATQYAEDSNPGKEIRLDWDPARRILSVADNGIEIRDTKTRTDLRGRDWKIRAELTPGQGTTFKLIALSGSITYSENYLARELAYQRRYFQRHKNFDFSRLIPEVLSQMTVMEQLEVGKQAVVEIETATVQMYDTIQSLPENDLQGLKIHMRTQHEITEAILRLRDARLDASIQTTFLMLFSSAIQLLNAQQQLHEVAYPQLKAGRITWRQALEMISNPRRWHQVTLKEDKEMTYEAPPARAELADTLFDWLRVHLPGRKSRLHGWIFEGPTRNAAQPGSLSPFTTWPPDPKNDLALKTYLEMLGWSMHVVSTSQRTVVLLDFRGQREEGNSVVQFDLATMAVDVPPEPAHLDDALVEKIFSANQDSKPFQKAFRIFQEEMPQGYRAHMSRDVTIRKAYVHELLTTGVRFWASGKIIQQSVSRALARSQESAHFWRATIERRAQQQGFLLEVIHLVETEMINEQRDETGGGEVISLSVPKRPAGDDSQRPPDHSDVFDWMENVLRALVR